MNAPDKHHDDNSEFINESVYADNTAESSHEHENIALAKKVKDRLRRLAEKSLLSRKQIYLFMSSAELDLLRKKDEQLGMVHLYEACCEKGSRYWLDPTPWLKNLDKILELYAGKGRERSRVLAPFVDLLTRCALNDINPSAFLQYIMEPRLSRDRDWRKWTQRHLQPLEIILSMLIKLRKSPPFDRAILGSRGNQMSRDVVLVKYGGKPLSLYSEADLADEEKQQLYLNAWQNLSLDNAFTIFFMKANVLHFMYIFSGKISFQHLIAILQQMPQIEEGFRENFPAESFNLDVSAIPLNLYDYDINKSILSRREKGFKNTDFTRELNAYMQIISSLLKTSAGIYLCGYFAKRLTALKNPDIAYSISELIEVLHDRGGKHIYIWHSQRLLKKKVNDHRIYLDWIIDNGGCDPAYPAARELFHDRHNEFLPTQSFRNTIAALDLTVDDIAQTTKRPVDSINGSTVTSGMVLNTFKEKFPEKGIVVDRVIEDVCEGRDRQWDEAMVTAIDSLGTALHHSLLKRIIRGISSTFFFEQKSSSFAELYSSYKTENRKYFYDQRVDFSLNLSDSDEPLMIDHKLQQTVRKQLDLKAFKDLWLCIMDTSTGIDDNIRYINQFSMALAAPIQKIESELVALTENKDSIDARQAKKIRKKQQSLKVLRQQKQNFDTAMSFFEKSPEEIKLIVAVLAAGAKAKTGDDFSRSMISFLIKRYEYSRELTDRLQYLRDDVPIELLTLEQAQWIINTVDVLNREFSRDMEVILKKNEHNSEKISEIVQPFIQIKSGLLNSDSLDAAFKSIVSYNKLTALTSKWQEILEESNLKEKKKRNFSIMTSHEPLDAYFGDMGSVCLSSYPELCMHPSFMNCRLISQKEKAVMGMALMYYSPYGIVQSSGQKGFWHVFAINPLPSFLNNISVKNQLTMYLHFRKIFESVSQKSGLPVVLSGISTWGIVSNSGNFADEIVKLETAWGGVETFRALGLEVHYSEKDFAHGLIIIDPGDEKTFRVSKYNTS